MKPSTLIYYPIAIWGSAYTIAKVMELKDHFSKRYRLNDTEVGLDVMVEEMIEHPSRFIEREHNMPKAMLSKLLYLDAISWVTEPLKSSYALMRPYVGGPKKPKFVRIYLRDLGEENAEITLELVYDESIAKRKRTINKKIARNVPEAVIELRDMGYAAGIM